MKKQRNLSKGFWHKFVPNSTKLISPQNIKLEIWDLKIHKIIEKWHPKIFCIHNCAFNQSGEKFILFGGCVGNESEFKIYDTKTFELLNEFWFPEQCCNAIFSLDDDTFIFGTWEGNIYKVNINDKIIMSETITKIDNKTFKDYKVSDENKIKLLNIENTMITLTESNTKNIFFFVVSPKSLGKTKDSHLLSDYILIYDLKTNETKEIKLPIEEKRYVITGLKFHNNKLAILKTNYGGEEKGKVFHNADLYIFDLQKNDLHLIKNNFQIRDVYSKVECLAWSIEDKLSYITLNEVVIVDTLNNNNETTIEIERPTSVEFSNNGKQLAIGAEKKAIIHEID